MVERNRFCGNCGAETVENERFCGNCGTSVIADESLREPLSNGVSTAPDTYSREHNLDSRTGSENILGIVPQAAMVKGFLGMGTRFMNIIVTDRRIICAIQTDKMEELMDLETESIEKMFQKKGGQWRQFIDTFDFSLSPFRKYLSMNVEDILEEHSENLSIPLEDVVCVKLTYHDDPELHSDSLVIDAISGNYELELPWGNCNLAKDVFGKAVKTITLKN